MKISDSVSVNTLDTKSNSTYSGNNTNLVFTNTNALVWTGAVNNSFSNADNWAGSVVLTANNICAQI